MGRKKEEEKARGEIQRLKRSIKTNAPLWAIISNVNPNETQRKAAIEKLKKNDLQEISKLFNGFLHKRVPVSNENVRKLIKDRETIETLANRSGSLRSKKNLLQQHGGFLPVLLPFLATSLAGPIMSAVLRKAIK